MPVRWLVIFLGIFLFTPNALAQTGYLDLEDLDKTMVTFESAFASKSEDSLRVISHAQAQREEYFTTLTNYIKCCRILSAYSTRRARQEYDAAGDRLAVEFIFRDGKWFLEDASLNGKSLARKGFSSVSSEYHFSTLLEAIASNKIEQYSGVRLGHLAKKRIVPRGTTVTLLNLIVHDGTVPRDIFYVRLRKYEQIENQRRGWLIDDVGSMLNYARRRNTSDPLLEFFANRSFFDLSRPSAFEFINMRAHESAAAPARLTEEEVVNLRGQRESPSTSARVAADDFDWSDSAVVTFNVTFDFNVETAPIHEWSAEVAADTLLLQVSPALIGVRFKPHTYLEVDTKGDAILLRVADVTPRPIRSFAGARVGTPIVNRQDASTRVVIPISVPR